jgi:hypothetical protein
MSQGSTSAGSRLGEFHGIEIYFEAGKGSTESIQVVEMREGQMTLQIHDTRLTLSATAAAAVGSPFSPTEWGARTLAATECGPPRKVSPEGEESRKRPRGEEEPTVSDSDSEREVSMEEEDTMRGIVDAKAAASAASVAGTPAFRGGLIKKDGGAPEARWGHTTTRISNNRLVVYGGQSEEDPKSGDDRTLGNLFVFDLESGLWDEPVNCESVPRAWHTASYLESKNLLVAFGGERMGDDCTAHDLDGEATGAHAVLDDIMVLDTEIFLWYPPAVSGRIPEARAGHTACLMGLGSGAAGTSELVELVIFGGTRGRKWENSVHVLNCDRWEWTRPRVSGRAPTGRSYHSATVVNRGRSMVVFGGNDDKKCFREVHVLSIKPLEGSASLSASSVDGATWEWSHPLVIGDGPAPRTGHAACLLPDGKSILVHGGWDPQDDTKDEVTCYRDAFLLDTETWEWRPAAAPNDSAADSAPAVGGVSGELKLDYAVVPASGSSPSPPEEFLRRGWTGHTIDSMEALSAQSSKSAGLSTTTATVALFGGQTDCGDRHSDLAVVQLQI